MAGPRMMNRRCSGGIAFLGGPTALLLAATIASAQESRFSLAPQLVASVDRVSSGGVAKPGWSASLGVRTSQHLGADLFVASSSLQSSPIAPELRIAGGWITLSVSRTPQQGADLFGGFGLAYFGVRGWPDFSGCQPPLCFYESARGFENGDSYAMVLGGGATYTLRFLLVRADVRWVLPNEGADQTVLNTGVGIGLTVP